MALLGEEAILRGGENKNNTRVVGACSVHDTSISILWFFHRAPYAGFLSINDVA